MVRIAHLRDGRLANLRQIERADGLAIPTAMPVFALTRTDGKLAGSRVGSFSVLS